MALNYYSVARLNSDLINHLLPNIPEDVDLIVAIPRDGVIVASLVSLYRQIPFTDLGSFLEGRIYRPGEKHRVKDHYNRDVRAIMLTDDICATGTAMKEAKSEIAALKLGIKVYAGPLYAFRPQEKLREKLIDFYGVEMKGGHYEWTLCDMFRSVKTAYDMDGVICTECPPGADDGAGAYLRGDMKYREFLQNAKLKLKPKEIGAIITWRPERYRKETEEWLARHGITYKQLIMVKDRKQWTNPAEFKAFHYKQLPLTLMIESSTKQAEMINKLSRKPVVSLANQQIYQ